MILLLILILTLCNLLHGYPSGAPTKVCDSMTPGHGIEQSGANPFSLEVTVMNYTTGTPVSVTVTGGEFQGILIQARKVGTNRIVGTFSDPGASANLKLLTCGRVAGSAVTHSSTDAKQNVTLTWNPPAAGVGNVEFIATVAKGKTTWWKNAKSSALTGSDDDSGGTGSANRIEPVVVLIISFLFAAVL